MQDNYLIALCQTITRNQMDSSGLVDLSRDGNEEILMKLGVLTASIDLDMESIIDIRAEGLAGCAAKAKVYLTIPSDALAASMADDLIVMGARGEECDEREFEAIG